MLSKIWKAFKLFIGPSPHNCRMNGMCYVVLYSYHLSPPAAQRAFDKMHREADKLMLSEKENDRAFAQGIRAKLEEWDCPHPDLINNPQRSTI